MTDGPRIVTFGETMGLATGRTTGPLTTARDYVMGFGGSESNVAIGVRRLGIDVTWVSKLGDDGLGELIRRELRAERVDILAPAVTGHPTGFMLKERRSSNHTAVTYYRSTSAAATISTEDLPDSVLSTATLLHTTGITPALSNSTREATLNAIWRAHDAGILVSFDLNYRSKLWSQTDAAAFYRQIMPFTDIVFAGEDEARLLFPDEFEHETLARNLADLGPSEAVIKRGENGATAVIDGDILSTPAIRIDVVDTVGAGDAFVAGYLAERVLGAPASDRLITAAATGALACTTHGDWEGSPTRADLERIGIDEAVER